MSPLPNFLFSRKTVLKLLINNAQCYKNFRSQLTLCHDKLMRFNTVKNSTLV
jgi:hypothetical protein